MMGCFFRLIFTSPFGVKFWRGHPKKAIKPCSYDRLHYETGQDKWERDSQALRQTMETPEKEVAIEVEPVSGGHGVTNSAGV
jgi:hypothetical protein